MLANGIPAAFGAIIAFAHPLTVIASFLGAPITSLNPTIGVGMAAGSAGILLFVLPGLWDFENLNTDIMSLKGWYKNRVTHIAVLVFHPKLSLAAVSERLLPFRGYLGIIGI